MNIARLIKLMSNIYDVETSHDLSCLKDPDSLDEGIELIDSIKDKKCPLIYITILSIHPTIYINSEFKSKTFYVKVVLKALESDQPEVICGIDDITITLTKSNGIDLELAKYDRKYARILPLEYIHFDEESITDSFFKLVLDNDYVIDTNNEILDELEKYYNFTV